MKSTNIKDLAEALGVAAIIGSLIFVGLQMKQTHEIAAAATYQETVSTEIMMATLHFQSDRLERIFMKQDTDEPLTPGEIRLWKSYLIPHFLTYENAHYQWTQGLQTDAYWEVIQYGIRWFLTTPHAREYWAENRMGFNESFRDAVDQIYAEPSDHVPGPKWTNESDRQSVIEAFEGIVKASESGDSSAYCNYLADDAMYLGPGAPTIIGRDAICDFVSEWFQSNSFFLDWTTDELVVIGDLAVLRVSGIAKIVNNESGEETEWDRKYMDIYRRLSDGQWVLARHMYNLNN